MRVLLTGAAGFVGRPALDLLRQRHEVTPFDLRPVEGVDVALQGDVLDCEAVARAVAGHDAVVNTIMAPNPTYGGNDLYPLKASGTCSLSKLLQEELARNYHEQHGMSIAVIRPWGIIDAERMVTTDGHPVTGHYWGTIDRRDVASCLVCALEADDIG